MLRRQNTKNCPLDGTPLHWETFSGMRVVRRDSSGADYYDAKCPQCRRRFRVAKTKAKKHPTPSQLSESHE